jgi:hypothetical protein
MRFAMVVKCKYEGTRSNALSAQSRHSIRKVSGIVTEALKELNKSDMVAVINDLTMTGPI